MDGYEETLGDNTGNLGGESVVYRGNFKSDDLRVIANHLFSVGSRGKFQTYEVKVVGKQNPASQDISEKEKTLLMVYGAAYELREAQKRYMAHRGNDELGAVVGECAKNLDAAMMEFEKYIAHTIL